MYICAYICVYIYTYANSLLIAVEWMSRSMTKSSEVCGLDAYICTCMYTYIEIHICVYIYICMNTYVHPPFIAVECEWRSTTKSSEACGLPARFLSISLRWKFSGVHLCTQRICRVCQTRPLHTLHHTLLMMLRIRRVCQNRLLFMKIDL